MKRRHTIEGQSKVLRSERTGMIYVPVEYRNGSWRVVVVGADRTDTYRPGGYDLIVFDEDVESDPEVSLVDDEMLAKVWSAGWLALSQEIQRQDRDPFYPIGKDAQNPYLPEGQVHP